MNAFETWLKNDYPEADLSRLPSGSYRVQSVRDMERAWLACEAHHAVFDLHPDVFPEVT
jgi:hypothetical protein